MCKVMERKGGKKIVTERELECERRKQKIEKKKHREDFL